MYLPRPVLILLVFVYLLFLVSVDWINNVESVWYRPFIFGLLVILVAAWVHREQDADEF